MSHEHDPSGVVIGIDASRNRSGGAKAHLIGILQDTDPIANGIAQVHVWAYKELLDALPEASWLIKHNPRALQQSLLHQVWWQYRSLPRDALRNGCHILLNTDAGSVCRFRPAVVISRDMLSYEPLEMKRYGVSRARIRLILLRFVQNASMRRADGVIFLTRYAAEIIQLVTGKLRHISIIPHGVGLAFRQPTTTGAWSNAGHGVIRCLYVSNSEPYKHQWMVVRAVRELRRRGHNIQLLLAGAGVGSARNRLKQEIELTDPHGEFVESTDFVPHREVPAYLARADIFVFASSCENMPVTLVEAMASGLPIACSDRGPMPEVLQDAGIYFNPEDVSSIATAIETIVEDPDLRAAISKRCRSLAEQYSWHRCGTETWAFLRTTFRKCSQDAGASAPMTEKGG